MNITIKPSVLFFFIFTTTSAYAIDPRLHWNTIASENFYIHYADGYEILAQKTANSAEQAHARLSPQINWQPSNKTHLVLSDETDSANGYATPINFNRSVLFVAPPDSANGLEDFDDWLETLITHEYTHILHLDKVSGAADFGRNILGRQFLLFPNVYQPGWFTEGLATYHETNKQKGIGRGQSSLYKMMMRSEVENGIKPASQVNLPIRSWPMGTVNYLYGVHFYQFIEDKYGTKGITALIENYSDNIIPFMINTNAQQVFEKDIDELWEEFSIWLNERYKPEISAQQKATLVEGKKITSLGYSTEHLDSNIANEIYYVANGAFEHAKLIHRINDTDNIVAEVHNRAKINTHKKSGVLIIQDEYCDEYNINSDLYVIENNNSEARRLTECGRYRSASWSADGQTIIAVKIHKGKSHLLLLNTQGEPIKNLWQGEDTDIVTQIKSSPVEDKIIAAVFRTGKGWNIEEFNLNTLQWRFITNDDHIDMYPSYSDAGKSIIFSSDRSGRYQIYRYKNNSNQLEQLTRVANGAFKSVQLNENAPLYYAGYNSNGRDIYELQNVQIISHESLTLPARNNGLTVESLAKPVTVSEAEDYSALSSLYPRWWFPFISLNNDRNEYGISTSGNDALGIHNYFLNLAYDTTNKWLVGDFRYAYANRFSLGYQRSTDILRTIAGDFAVARNVDDLFLTVGFSDLGIESSIRYQLGVVVSKSADGIRADGIPPQQEIKDNLVGAAVLFNNTQNYIRSISSSDGRKIRGIVETTDLLESFYSGEIYTLDWREFLSLGKQNVLAIRLVQGWGTNQPNPFRLGGEDNEFDILNFVNPISEPLFDKRKYALRGYAEGLPQLSGRHMQLGSLEWRFPGTLIERGLMSPPVGIIQWSGSVFVESGAAYQSTSPDQYYSSAGLELQADVNLFYGLTTRMRLGYASGFDSDIGEDRIYFNLGASF